MSQETGSPLKPKTKSRTAAESAVVTFATNAHLPQLFGQHDQNLARIEQRLNVQIASRGNSLVIGGGGEAVAAAEKVLRHLHHALERGHAAGIGEVDNAIRLVEEKETHLLFVRGEGRSGAASGREGATSIHTKKRVIEARSETQARYIRELETQDLVFAAGPAGTGKTYLAVAMAVSELLSGAVDRIILSRPAVEAGESLGFLPGDMKEKVDPYLRPLYDALYDTMPAEQVVKHLETGEIEIAPVAFMRGRTLSHAFVILDEAQNTTPVQMKMFLTRLGENSRMVVTGDPSQVDLLPGMASGLAHAMGLLEGIEGVSIVRFTEKDVIRNSLVRRIINAYDGPKPPKKKA
jgi:phosphate starvation-inducible protein PhoH and related proteins